MNNRAQDITDKIVSSLNSLADALANGDPIAEKFTCRNVTLDLKPFPYSAAHVKATRKLLRVSQAVFAQLLGVKLNTLKSWEQDRQVPSDMASRFMDEIQRDPDYWRKRLRDAIRVKEIC